MRHKNGFAIVALLFLIFLALAAVAVILILKPSPKSGPITKPTLKPSPVSSSPATTPLPSQLSDLPPLYPGVDWGEPKEGEQLFIDESGEIVKKNGYYIESKTLENSNEFIDFYTEKLKKLDWKEVDYASGTEGEIISYVKGEKHLTIGYKHTSDIEFNAFLEYD
jgi:hypothetical protein